MKHPYKICFIGCGQIFKMAEEVSRRLDLPDTIVEVVNCSLSALTEVVDQKICQGFEVFMSGSAYATELSRYSRTPVAEIPVQDIDYLAALKKAFAIGRRPLLVTYRYSRPVNLKLLQEFLGADIDHIVFEGEEELYQKIAKTSNDVIVAASVACGYAADLGRKSVLVYAGKETVYQSFLHAHTLAVELRKEREEDVLLRSIIAQSPSGIIATDEADRIILVNSAALEYTGLKACTPYQKTLSECLPSLSTEQFLQDNTERKESFKIFGDIRVHTVQSKLRIDENTFGVLTTLQINNNRSKKIKKPDYFRPDIHWDDLTAFSEPMRCAILKGKLYASSPLPLLLYGEYSVGKLEFAECVHTGGPRAENPLVVINLAAISENDAGRYLLGCSDSNAPFTGLLETAENGTVILQNLPQANPAVQACLADVLLKQHIIRTGGVEAIPIHIRFITALNGECAIPDTIRPELSNLLSTLAIKIPRLSERKEDVPELFEKELPKRLQRKIACFGCSPVTEILQLYHWPGNLSELHAVANRFSAAAEECSRLSANTMQTLLIKAIGQEKLFQGMLVRYPELEDWKSIPIEQLTAIIGLLKRLLRYNNTQISEKLGIGRTTLWRLTNSQN